MRISTAQFYQAGLRNIQNAQASVARTQAEIAASKRVLTPADDPAGSALVQRIEQDAALRTQYTRNIDVAQSDLTQQETHLSTVENILFRLRELVVQAGDGALGSTERQAIAGELSERAQELLGIYNVQLANGEYLFSGFQGQTVAFIERPAGRVDFQGDSGRRFVQVSAGVDVEVRDNGKGLFVDIAAANNTFITSAGATNTGSGDISVGRIVDQAAYDAVFPDELVVEFDNPLGAGSFSIYQVDRTSGVQSLLDSQAYVAGQSVTVAGVAVTLQGVPATGDRFSLHASNTQSLLTTIQRAVLAVGGTSDSVAGTADRQQAIAETLNNLTQAETHIFSGRAALGSRLNILDTVREEHAQLKLIDQGLVSEVADLDYNEAISRLSFQSFALEAAQKGFARVANISLFNFLR